MHKGMRKKCKRADRLADWLDRPHLRPMTLTAQLATNIRRVRALVGAGASLARIARVTGLPEATLRSMISSPAMRASKHLID